MPEENQEGADYGDISSRESVDGLVVPTTNPFYPNIEFRYSDEGDFEGYKVDFNQGYIFNRVSATQVDDIGDTGICTISQMAQSFELEKEHDKKFYVEASISASNFLIESAIFTGFDADGDQPSTEFPQIIFADEVEKASYTGYFPVLQLKNGSLLKYTQRNNIFLSDRQFKQLGAEGENQAQVLVKNGKSSESNPVRVRAVRGEGDIEVIQEANYIVISGASGASGFTGENVGGGAEVYVEASTDPAQFRTLTGAENIEISVVGQTVEIKSEDQNCGSADWNAYIDGTTNPALFRGLNAGTGIFFDTDATGCATTISRSCCDLEGTSSVGAFTTNNITINSSVDVGTSPLNVVTDTTNHEAITVYCGGQIVQEYKTDSSCNAVVEINDSSATTVNKLTASSFGNYFNTHTAIGSSSPDSSYSLYVNGNVKIQDSSNANNGKLQFGNSTDNTIEIDQSNGEFRLGAGVTKIESAQSDTMHVFSQTSADYSAIDCSLVNNSPATGSAILGGSGNHISGNFDVIVAGVNNAISGGFYNFIGGGTGIDITGSSYSSSIGGLNNDIFGSDYAIIGGGNSNKIEHSDRAFVGGGGANHIVGANFSTIGGGQNNTIRDKSSLIGGGESNEIRFQAVDGGYNFIGAGVSNIISGGQSSIAGGNNNIISGSRSVTLGGAYQNIAADDAVTAGNYSKVQPTHDGAFVFSDSTTTPSLSSGTNSMVMDFANGVYVNTNTALYVNGNAVLTGETPEGDTLQSVTDRGNETTTSIISTGPYISGVTGLFSSNVGIGTNNPTFNLDVYEDSSETVPMLKLRQDGVGDASIGFNIIGSTQASIGLDNSDGDKFKISRSEALGASTQLTIDSSGNVGIGITNPATKLHVSDSIAGYVSTIENLGTGADKSGLWVKTDSSWTSAVILKLTGGTSDTSIMEVNPATVRIGGGNLTQNDAKLHVQGTSFFFDQAIFDDKVGIGTTSPTAKLTVATTMASSPTSQLYLDVDGSNAVGGGGEVIFNTSASAGTLTAYNAIVRGQRSSLNDGSSDLLFLTTHQPTTPTSAVRMIVKDSGNVGIGTTSPNGKLHVNHASDAGTYARLSRGTTNIDFDLGAAYAEITSTIKQFRVGTSDAQSFHLVSNDSNRLSITSSGEVGIGTTNPSAKLEVATSANVNSHSDGAIQVVSSSPIAFVAPSNLNPSLNRWGFTLREGGEGHFGIRDYRHANTRVTIDDSGNVGIGTTSPSGLLHVSSGTSGDAVVIIESDTDNNNEDDNPQLQFKQDGGITIAKAGLAGNAGTVFTNSLANAAYFGNDEAASLQLYTNATAQLTIESGGDVGIGTTNPNVKLHVEGDPNAAGVLGRFYGSATHGALLQFHRGASYNWLAGIGGGSASAGVPTSYFGIVESGNSPRLVIAHTTGNVGIGTTSPSARLHISDSSTSKELLRVGASANGYWKFQNAGSTTSRVSLTAYDSSGNSKIYLNPTTNSYFNNGNVGIGITNPDHTLRVNGDTRLGNLHIKTSDFGVSGTGKTIYADGAGSGVLGFISSTAFDFSNGTTSRLHINSSGNVGIGTTSPSKKLEIASNTTYDGIQVSGTSIPRIAIIDTTNNATLSAYARDNDATIGTESNHPLTLNTNGTERMRISSAGAIKFNNYGAGTFTGTVTQKLGVDSSGNVIEMPIGAGPVDGSGTANYLARWIDSDTLGIGAAYDNGTNVGIGTTNPAAKLHIGPAPLVSGYTSTITTLAVSDTTNGAELILRGQSPRLWFDSSAGGIGEIYLDSTHLNFLSGDPRSGAAGSSSLYIKSNGNVGIGTTSPATKLHIVTSNVGVSTVYADVAIEAVDAQLDLTSSSSGSWGSAINFVEGASTSANTDVWSIARQTTGGSGDSSLRFNFGTSNEHNNDSKITFTSTGRVGIGTTSPAKKLEVNVGGTSSDGILVVGSLNPHIEAKDSTNSVRTVIASEDSLGKVGTISSTDLKIVTGNSERIRVDTSGNVGIGTTSPTAPLTFGKSVYGGTSSENFFRVKFKDNGGIQNDVGIGQSDVNSLEFNKCPAGIFSFNDGTNGEVMRIHSDGNVGIGTTSPTDKLHVYGNARIGSTSQTTTSLFLTATNTAGSPAIAVRTIMQGYEGRAIGTFYTDTTYSGEEWYCGMNYSGGFNRWSVGYDQSGGQAEYLANAKFTVFHNGNVGIGTTNPATKLSVSGGDISAYTSNGTSRIFVSEDGTTGFNGLVMQCNGGANNTDFYTTNTGNGMWISAIGGSSDIGLSANRDIYLKTDNGGSLKGGTTQVTVKQGGNVGIGTTDPEALLEIASNSATDYLKLRSLGGGSTPIKLIFKKSSSEQGVIEYNRNGDLELYNTDADGGVMIDGSASAGGDFYVANSGNVGIGTTSPSQTLHIVGGSADQLLIENGTSSGTSQIQFKANSNRNAGPFIKATQRGNSASDSDLQLGDESGSILTLNGGNVGIGTISPDEVLEVKGIIKSENTGYTNTGFIINQTSHSDAWRLMQFGGGAFSLNLNGYTSGQSRFQVSTSGDVVIPAGTLTVSGTGDSSIAGNVGIGTTSPQAKLQVSGGIQMADDTDTASASKVGTMRYRTGTEYVEVDGVELVTNGDFATDTNWNKQNGSTVSGGVGNVIAKGNLSSTGGNWALNQNIGMVIGSVYKVSFKVKQTVGTGNFQIGQGYQIGFNQSVTSVFVNYSFNITASDWGVNTGIITIGGATLSDEFEIDNVSVMKVTAEDASYADMCMQTAASTYEWVNIVRNSY